MSERHTLRLSLEQDGDYAFRIHFDGSTLEALLTDEPPPLGGGAGPDPAQLLLAGVANCLAASLVFALRKFKNAPAPIRADIEAVRERNDAGRWRLPRAQVTLRLADPAASLANFDRALAQFEQFCIVTQSVREGIAVDVRVVDGDGIGITLKQDVGEGGDGSAA